MQERPLPTLDCRRIPSWCIFEQSSWAAGRLLKLKLKKVVEDGIDGMVPRFSDDKISNLDSESRNRRAQYVRSFFGSMNEKMLLTIVGRYPSTQSAGSRCE